MIFVGMDPVHETESMKKKARIESRRVAEIVLVLSAMGEMRGGCRSPTAVEGEMMAEARGKVAVMCQAWAPKDFFQKEAVVAAIEDLGFSSKAKDIVKLGFRPPKMSIADRFSLSKRRMEESKTFAAHSGSYSSQRLQTPNSSNYAPTTGGSSSSLPYQLHTTSEGRPSMLSSSSLPRVERASFRLDSPLQDSTVVHAPVNSPTWSLQPQSAPAARSVPPNKVQIPSSINFDGTASRVAPQATSDHISRPIVPQTNSAHFPSAKQPSQVMNAVQASPLSNNHNEFAKIVHNFLQPRLPVHPTWIPPSRDYMNKPLACQICQLTINQVENALLCDACEKGFHLKCLQAFNQKAIPRGEWHCPKCLTLSNGKPLPPKYGRVMRNMNTSKLAQLPSDKKVGISDQKDNSLKITANGGSFFQNPSQTETIGSEDVESRPTLGNPNLREYLENNILASNVDDKIISETNPHNCMKSTGTDCNSLVGPSIVRTSVQEIQNSNSSLCEERQGKVSISKSKSPVKLPDAVTNVSENPDASTNSHDVHQTGVLECTEMPTENHLESNNEVKDSDAIETLTGNSSCAIKQGDQDNASASPDGTTGVSNGTTGVSNGTTGVSNGTTGVSNGTTGVSNGSREHDVFSTDGTLSVDWIGDALEVVDEKTFYSSCRINGVVYKVQDHAFFRSSNDKLVPSNLQAMWEDSNTGSKWVVVNCCYFPGDMPEVAGRPCAPESNEVYESNHNSTVMAGLIQGKCEVLPPEKYKEESQRRSLGNDASEGVQPVFLCKWLYDELKGIFQPIST